MKFTVIDCEQRSETWHQARLGRLTASRASDMLATRKDGHPSASRQNLLTQLVLERLTSKVQERDFRSAAMDEGTAREPEAQATYELLTGSMLRTCGFLRSDEVMAGASLDGYVDDMAGIVELKNPLAATHLGYLKSGKIPPDYLAQITHQLWISGARWCDWLSYHPDFPEPLRHKLVRVERDEAAIAEYAKKATAFLREVELEELALRTALEGVHG